jgi:hypothetical protein
MSNPAVFAATTAATTGATAAAAAAKRLRAEEEDMTRYGAEDLEVWEFKIVRSSGRAFRKPEDLRRICAEEARFGWELQEKFDDYRARFKRRTELREKDRYQEGDPYRTQLGMSSERIGMAIAIGILVAALATGLAFFLMGR